MIKDQIPSSVTKIKVQVGGRVYTVDLKAAYAEFDDKQYSLGEVGRMVAEDMLFSKTVAWKVKSRRGVTFVRADEIETFQFYGKG